MDIMDILFELLKIMWITIAVMFTLPIFWVVGDWAITVIIEKIKENTSERKNTD